ncbi:hypothetical protein JOD31_000993 [Methylopila capsulata]|uniref:Uncharacterized protein n=1 Tax=Methylopila capsulata TaxID=61654 RepID=A0A9W6IVK2_9HYPH|nr:hypothetical protein [Methylopila capsulata]MBM7850781.1 hypothetical protein [Methylopila capsulata]GLK56075.1 hypothetical protein GCM10008170_20940 [Methylopila capsulata]
MTRIASVAAVLATLISTSAFAGELSSIVDAPKAPVRASAANAAAVQSPGTVGAMHLAADGVATSGADVRRDSRGLLTAANASWRAVPVVTVDALVTKPGT